MEKWKAFLNRGTKTEVFIKKAMVVILILLLMYRLGYGVGTFLANVGL